LICTRIACCEDAAAISDLLTASWKSAYRGIVNDPYLDELDSVHWVDYLISGMKDKSIWAMVLEKDRDMIGAAVLRETENKGQAELISFYLSPDRIGQGFGHVFYAAIEGEIKSRSLKKCVLDVLEHNNRAIQFYEKHGYAHTGHQIEVSLGKDKYVCKVYEKSLK
jgi:GNAT superfamily N-acetyltransferase